MSHNVYTHTDGTVGVGFLIEHSGKPMHSIAWPDKPAERMTIDEIARKKINVRSPLLDGSIANESEVGTDLEIGNEPGGKPKSEAQHIRDYLAEHPDAENSEVIEALESIGVEVTSSQVGRQRSKLKKSDE
ncbi:MAG: hypothetical protein ACF788_01310 [Novipirellula sp. JB048]